MGSKKPRSLAEIEKQEREMTAMREATAKFLAKGGPIKTESDRQPQYRDGKPIKPPRENKPGPRWEENWSDAIQRRVYGS